jgi:hypothetical protein
MNQDSFLARIAALAGQPLRTPSKRKEFTFACVGSDRLVVSTEGANKVYVTTSSIEAVLRYLVDNGYDREHPCPVRSSNQIATAGPLCLIAREGGKQRKITYVLPILERLGLVVIDTSVRPMTTYLAPSCADETTPVHAQGHK